MKELKIGESICGTVYVVMFDHESPGVAFYSKEAAELFLEEHPGYGVDRIELVQVIDNSSMMKNKYGGLKKAAFDIQKENDRLRLLNPDTPVKFVCSTCDSTEFVIDNSNYGSEAVCCKVCGSPDEATSK